MDGAESIWSERRQHEVVIDEVQEWRNRTELPKGCQDSEEEGISLSQRSLAQRGRKVDKISGNDSFKTPSGMPFPPAFVNERESIAHVIRTPDLSRQSATIAGRDNNTRGCLGIVCCEFVGESVWSSQ